MTDADLIAMQAKKIAEQGNRIVELETAKAAVLGRLYCIGGPLNDNVMGYTAEQKRPFFAIADDLENA